MSDRGAHADTAVEDGHRACARKPVDILIVDDTPGKLLALESALAPLGENLVSARSGREALRHLLDRDFATIILDVNMPDLDGFETARMIRARKRSAATPIIFISAVNMDEADSYQGYSLGAVDYICAPIIPEVLRAKVSVFVELHRKSEEARLQAERLQQRTLELERSQRDLRLSERMASIGTLCAGLGHDMGNLLLPVGVWIDSICPASMPEDFREGVENLRACVQYLRKLASGLRLVSLDPSQDAGDGDTSMSRWVEDVGPILRNALPRSVALEIEVAQDLPPVRIAPHRLAQTVFNLVQNAGEALRDRPDGVVRLWVVRDGASVRIGVSDNGPGMSDKVLARCLDPFFTTKTRGISTGLGLSLVHGIVQSAGARLEVESSANRGTTFAFALPIVADASRPKATVVITVGDARSRAVASALVHAAGCEIKPAIDEVGDGPAVWVTAHSNDLERQAEEFVSGRDDRRIILLADKAPDADGVIAAQLTGPQGLGLHLRRFLTSIGSRQAERPAPV